MARPWKVVAVVRGFQCEAECLQFEWAIKHKAKVIKSSEDLIKPSYHSRIQFSPAACLPILQLVPLWCGRLVDLLISSGIGFSGRPRRRRWAERP
eukprot:320415-Prorocentrum_minimum.AAC.1